MPTPDYQDGKGNLDPVVTLQVRTPGKNKKGKDLNNITEIAVIARTGDFPECEIMDSKNIIHYVLSMSTFAINNEVDAEFREEYTNKQQALNTLLYNHGVTLKDLRYKAIDGKEPITEEERKLLDRANNAESEISDIYLEVNDTINDRVKERRQSLINHLSLEDMGDIVTAVKIYIGNFYFWKMVEVWDLLMFDIEKSVNAGLGRQLSQEEQLSFIENSMKEIKKLHFDGRKIKSELLNGKKYDRKQPAIGASGGIAPFLAFIKKHDAKTHGELTVYIKWAMKTSTRQFRYTPQRNLEIYYSALQEKHGDSKSVRIMDMDSEDYP